MARRIVAFAQPPADTSVGGVAELVYLGALLKLPEAVGETGSSLKTLQRAYVNGRLKITRFGARGIRIKRRDLLAWVDAGAPTDKLKETR